MAGKASPLSESKHWLQQPIGKVVGRNAGLMTVTPVNPAKMVASLR